MDPSQTSVSSFGRDTPKHGLGPGDKMGEGDTELVLSILPDDLAQVAFDNMRKEVQWNTMHHRGELRLSRLNFDTLNDPCSLHLAGGEVPRLVAVEGDIDETDGR